MNPEQEGVVEAPIEQPIEAPVEAVPVEVLPEVKMEGEIASIEPMPEAV